ncbi:MAG: endonuclease/exonuclease/phosphatase family protein [Pseudomonadota bacterium]
MQIICLNAWGGRLHAPLMAYLADADPDLLCVQEVVHAPHSNAGWLTYRDDGQALPQRANLFSEIAACLPGHVAQFCSAARGDLWDGDSSVSTLWGIATYVRRSLPIIAQSQGFVHGGFGPDGFGAHPRSRNAHAVRVFDHERGAAVTIAHMHGLRDPQGKADTPERMAQTHRLMRLVGHLAGPEDPLIVCGDFNVLPDSGMFPALAELGLRELVTEGGWAGTRSSHYAKPQRFADYMLVNPHIAQPRFEVVRDPEVSDHCPLMLEI